MKHVVLVATLVASLSAAAVVSGQTAPAAGSSLGSVTLAKRSWPTASRSRRAPIRCG